MLTGVIVFVYPGDAAQIAVTIMITFFFFVTSEVLLPYESRLDTWLNRGGHIVVFCSFFVALLHKVDLSSEREDSQQAFGVVLVLAHACLILVVLVQVVGIWLTKDSIEDALASSLRGTHKRVNADQRHVPVIPANDDDKVVIV